MKYICLPLLFILALAPLIIFIGWPLPFLARQYLSSILLLLFAAFLWRSKKLRLFAIIVAVLWTVDTSISLETWYLYKQGLSLQLAITMLISNVNESIDFFLGYWEILLIGLILFSLVLFLVSNLSKCLARKTLIIASCLFISIPGYKFVESFLKGRLNDPNFLVLEKILPYASLNNAAYFHRAFYELSLLNAINDYSPHYSLKLRKKDIDDYIIVLGESVRRKNTSLYGYFRDTTPSIISEKRNMYVFNQAISTAPITTLSLSNALTIKEVDSQSNQLIADNIINLANHAGFETYWLSRQEVTGRMDTVITAIANFSNHQEWITDGYDDVLITRLNELLSQPSDKKRLFILHTYGSHLSACNQYPKTEHYFTDGESKYVDCYDNSIRYTDKILGSLFERIKDKKVSVLYFSDHGQRKRVKYNGVIDFVHGSVNPNKEVVNVPQFIWFSPAIDAVDKKVGVLETRYSLTDNYHLVQDWLGIDKKGEINTHSPLNDNYIPRKKIMVIDTHENLFDYNELAEE